MEKYNVDSVDFLIDFIKEYNQLVNKLSVETTNKKTIADFIIEKSKNIEVKDG